MTLILIQANEGYTDMVLVAPTLEKLLDVIRPVYEPYPGASEEDREFFRRECEALTQMVEQHQDWQPGRYVLPNIEPHWQEWTLVIPDESGLYYGTIEDDSD